MRPANSSVHARRGMAVAAVLISLVVVLLFAATLTRSVMTQYRQSRVDSWRQQAFWIAESAIQRALFNARRNPAYQGETWSIPADVLGTDMAGRAVIQVRTESEPQPGHRVRVAAIYPDQPRQRILFERELFVPAEPDRGS